MNVLVTGGTGLVGKAIENVSISNDRYEKYNYKFLSSKCCDLTDLESTIELFRNFKPDYVIHLAAFVGGLFRNLNHKVDMFEVNTLINYNILKCCHDFKVKKCVSCLSTCIFPDKTNYPINETMLHTGPPHDSNYPYAYAKRMLEIHSRSYYEQYNDKFVCVIPTNIYGPHDNFSLENGHVIPALIHKCFIAKQNNEPFEIKGTGKPLRQFIFSKDLAELILWTLDTYDDKEPIILSVSESDEISIKYVATCIAKAFNYTDNLVFDDTFSDGQFKKTADNSKFLRLHGKFDFTNIEVGIQKSVKWFIDNFESSRK
tara:strand:- start:16055 stop:16999 length:945 start_codon:yes stop_codon:yes gene_type:complete